MPIGFLVGTSVEDHIFHRTTPQVFRPLFSQNPADCIHHIALAATIGTNNNRYPILLKLDVNRMAERLETRYFEAFDPHKRYSSAIRQEEGNWDFPLDRKILPLGIVLCETQNPQMDQKVLK